MNHLTFTEAYQRVVDAYETGKIDLINSFKCFCGVLADNNKWRSRIREGEYPFTVDEYLRMENAVILTVDKNTINSGLIRGGSINISTHKLMRLHDNYEEALYQGMIAGIQAMYEIYIDRGEETIFPEHKLQRRQVCLE